MPAMALVAPGSTRVVPPSNVRLAGRENRDYRQRGERSPGQGIGCLTCVLATPIRLVLGCINAARSAAYDTDNVEPLLGGRLTFHAADGWRAARRIPNIAGRGYAAAGCRSRGADG